MTTWTLLAKTAGKSHSSSKQLCSGSLPPRSLCYPDSFSKLVSALDVNFLRFIWFWDSRRKGRRNSIIDLLPGQITSFTFFSSDRWKVTENSLRVRNGAQDGREARNQEGVWFSLARLGFFVQQIYTSLSPTELLNYYKIVKHILSNTSFASDFCSRQWHEWIHSSLYLWGWVWRDVPQITWDKLLPPPSTISMVGGLISRKNING